jgi:hypothetical protein
MGILRVGHETFRSVWNVGCVHLMRRSRLPRGRSACYGPNPAGCVERRFTRDRFTPRGDIRVALTKDDSP